MRRGTSFLAACPSVQSNDFCAYGMLSALLGPGMCKHCHHALLSWSTTTLNVRSKTLGASLTRSFFTQARLSDVQTCIR